MKILTMEINPDVERIETHTREIDPKNKLNEFYRYLNCSTIDIVEIEVDGYFYDVICDDEALLKTPKIPVLYVNKDLIIFGSVAFCKCDRNGNSIGLTRKDIDRLTQYLYRQDAKLSEWLMKR